MKFNAVILGSLLSANAVMGARFSHIRKARAAERRDARLARKTSPPQGASSNGVMIDGNSTQVTYDSNWAGAVLVSSGFTSVTGTITVPTPQTPPGGSSSTQYSSSAWVGIDGDTCTSAILQTGVDFTVQGSSVSYDAWYEWYPDYAYDYGNFDVSAGDQIQMTVTATSKSTGTSTLDNLTTGQKVTHTFTNTEGNLCETNAEWIVEDFEENNGLVPFADFGTVTFTGASATKNGATVGVSGAQIFDIEQNNKVLTSCSTSGSSTVTCTYE